VLAATTAGGATAMLASDGALRAGRWHTERIAGRRGNKEADVERTDWLDVGFDAAQAQFLMVTAITHHRFSSPLWGEDEVRKLHAELAEIASTAAQITRPTSPPQPSFGRLAS
jgi:hypothetical protein